MLKITTAILATIVPIASASADYERLAPSEGPTVLHIVGLNLPAPRWDEEGLPLTKIKIPQALDSVLPLTRTRGPEFTFGVGAVSLRDRVVTNDDEMLGWNLQRVGH